MFLGLSAPEAGTSWRMRTPWDQWTVRPVGGAVNASDNHDSVVTHLEPDMLECEVKWALESITVNKAREGDGIPAELSIKS